MGGPVEAQLFVPAKQNNHNPEILSKYWPIYRYRIYAEKNVYKPLAGGLKLTHSKFNLKDIN